MVKSSADTEGAIAAIRKETGLRAHNEAWPVEVWARLYELYASLGGFNCSKALRLYQLELGPDAMTPALRTVQERARFEGWDVQALGDLEKTQGRRLHALQSQYVAIAEQGADTLVLVGQGAFDDNVPAGALRLKAAEIGNRMFERGLMPFTPAAPLGSEVRWEDLSEEEQQALARRWMMERKGKGDGG